MTVVLNKFFSTLLMHFFLFLDEESATVNHERKLGKEVLGEVGGEGGGRVGNDRSKGVYPEEDIIIAASAMQPCQ